MVLDQKKIILYTETHKSIFLFIYFAEVTKSHWHFIILGINQ